MPKMAGVVATLRVVCVFAASLTLSHQQTVTTTPLNQCNYQLDLVLAIDGSNSMYPSNFNTQKSALVNLINNLNVTPLDINVGLVLFSGSVTSFPLSGDKQQIINNINSFSFPDESTHTDLAIQEASEIFKQARGGNVKKLLIIVTDGRATFHDQAVQAATLAKSAGIMIYALGVTDAVDEVELVRLASSRQQVHISANFSRLQNDLIQATFEACINVCNHHLDLVIAIDSSNSMFASNFQTERNAIINLVNNLPVTPLDIHVGLIAFSTTVISHALSGDKEQVINNINDFPFMDASTHTHQAITESQRLFNTARGGNVPKILILITDGRATNHQQAVQAAEYAKASGLVIYTIGVTSAIDSEELMLLASSPQHVLHSDTYQDLQNELFQATYRACTTEQWK